MLGLAALLLGPGLGHRERTGHGSARPRGIHGAIQRTIDLRRSVLHRVLHLREERAPSLHLLRLAQERGAASHRHQRPHRVAPLGRRAALGSAPRLEGGLLYFAAQELDADHPALAAQLEREGLAPSRGQPQPSRRPEDLDAVDRGLAQLEVLFDLDLPRADAHELHQRLLVDRGSLHSAAVDHQERRRREPRVEQEGRPEAPVESRCAQHQRRRVEDARLLELGVLFERDGRGTERPHRRLERPQRLRRPQEQDRGSLEAPRGSGLSPIGGGPAERGSGPRALPHREGIEGGELREGPEHAAVGDDARRVGGAQDHGASRLLPGCDRPGELGAAGRSGQGLDREMPDARQDLQSVEELVAAQRRSEVHDAEALSLAGLHALSGIDDRERGVAARRERCVEGDRSLPHARVGSEDHQIRELRRDARDARARGHHLQVDSPREERRPLGMASTHPQREDRRLGLGVAHGAGSVSPSEVRSSGFSRAPSAETPANHP